MAARATATTASTPVIVATPHRQRPQIATDRRSARAWCPPLRRQQVCIICCRVVGRVEIFSAHNSGQLVEVGRRFADIARTVAGGTAPCSPLNTTV